jgi:Helicase HerA, central domain
VTDNLYRLVTATRPRHTFPRLVWRYCTGARLDGRDAPGVTAWGRLPRWRRAAWRLSVPGALVVTLAAYATHPLFTETAGAVVIMGTIRLGRRWWRTRRFRRTYTKPTLGALRTALGDAPVQLRVDPSLGTLMPRLARTMSPAETAVRRCYGERVEPVLRWAPDRVQRGRWALQRAARPVTGRLATWLLPPRVDKGPRIELRASMPYLTDDQRKYVSAVLGAKLPAGELVESWDQVGTHTTGTWTVRRRPPSMVGFADLAARFAVLAEDEFFVGLGVGSAPVKLSLSQDSPHVACSAGTGAGKSVFALLIAVQVLARGGRVVILDRKGSHRWARGLAGVTYCTQAGEMHDALIALAALAEDRNATAFEQDDGWDPGHRVFLIAEELNATIGQLRAHWDDNRPKGGVKASPAIRALGEILFMGRSAKVNVFAVAQMLTAKAIGGPEARENFGIRALARYSVNAWKMLVPEAGMPPSSRTQGRWQVVIGGVVTAVQVAYLSAAEARLFVAKHRPDADVATPTQTPLMGSDQGLNQRLLQEPAGERLLTLQEATAEGVVPWPYHAARQRLRRARKAGRMAPEAVRREGTTDLYARTDLLAWSESEVAA